MPWSTTAMTAMESKNIPMAVFSGCRVTATKS
jgi:hypothetical protein